jgi:hypothetical protein
MSPINVADTMPKLAIQVLSFAGPEGKFLGAVLGSVLGALAPSDGPSISDIVLMAVEDLENFITSQFNDVEVRDAGAKIQATYGWFKDNYDTAQLDSNSFNVPAASAEFMRQVLEALGPNSLLLEGIAKLSDPRYRATGISLLCFGIGLRLTLSKILILVNNDLSKIPSVVADINSYKDTVTSAKREADAAIYAELNKPEYYLNPSLFRSRRDELVQQWYQGDGEFPGRAIGRLDVTVAYYAQLRS